MFLIQLFPNLKDLYLSICLKKEEDPKNMLSQILPYVPNLNILNLTINPNESVTFDASTLLLEVTRLPELEKLSFTLRKFKLENTELFLNQLSTSCPKLRDLHLCE